MRHLLHHRTRSFHSMALMATVLFTSLCIISPLLVNTAVVPDIIPLNTRQLQQGQPLDANSIALVEQLRQPLRTDHERVQPARRRRSAIKKNRVSRDESSSVVNSSASLLIIEGVPSDTCQWPYLVAITKRSGEFVCAASLIADKWLLSAAHCFKDITSGQTLFAQLGAYNLSANDQLRTMIISRIVAHPEYDPGSYGVNDIALLELNAPVLVDKMNSSCIQTATLPQLVDVNIADVSNCVIIGWGVTEPSGKVLSDVVMQKCVQLMVNGICQWKWGLSLFSDETIYDENVCVESADDFTEGTSCQGDSGGPLQCYSNSRNAWILEGVASWGSSACKFYPSVYMRVRPYMTWIYKEIARIA